MTKNKKVFVIHGPNLNMLGKREPDIYGKMTLDEIDAKLLKIGETLRITVETFQSNHEGAIVDKIQKAVGNCQGLIINPGAFTHTSIAIRDAILMLDIPIIEVHLSNVYKREPFRHKSMISDIVTAKMVGFGANGYFLALEAIKQTINRHL